MVISGLLPYSSATACGFEVEFQTIIIPGDALKRRESAQLTSDIMSWILLQSSLLRPIGLTTWPSISTETINNAWEMLHHKIYSGMVIPEQATYLLLSRITEFNKENKPIIWNLALSTISADGHETITSMLPLSLGNFLAEVIGIEPFSQIEILQDLEGAFLNPSTPPQALMLSINKILLCTGPGQNIDFTFTMGEVGLLDHVRLPD